MLSIEAFVMTNFLMNLLVTGVGARAVGHIRFRRAVAAACAGTIYAVAAYAYLPFLRGFAAQTVCLIVMTAILFQGGRDRSRRFRGFMIIAGSCMFAGGVMTIFRRWLSPGNPLLTAAGWLIVGAGAFLTDSLRPGSGIRGTVLLRIATRMGSAEVEALIDTGNRLHEPLSGLPVIVVGRKQLVGLLDHSCLEKPGRRLPPGFRMVRYGALGGGGEMLCFRPESVYLWKNRAWTDAPDLWIAIYPGDIPSGVEALAPPVF